MHIRRHTRKLAIDPFVLNNSLDLIDRSGASVPRRLSVIVAKIMCQFLQFDVGDIGEVSSRVASIHRSDLLALGQRHRETGLLQEICCCNTGDTCADDNDVDVHVLF